MTSEIAYLAKCWFPANDVARWFHQPVSKLSLGECQITETEQHCPFSIVPFRLTIACMFLSISHLFYMLSLFTTPLLFVVALIIVEAPLSRTLQCQFPDESV